jgi:hypothetical protein
MKKDYREIKIKGQKELFKLEKFVEEICDYHNINNEYFGNILLASTEAANILISIGADNQNTALTISFEKNLKGFTFKIKLTGKGPEEGKEFKLEQEVRKHRLAREIYIIKALADEVTISVQGESITMTFYVSSINYEKSLSRINKLKDYWIRKKTAIHKGND